MIFRSGWTLRFLSTIWPSRVPPMQTLNGHPQESFSAFQVTSVSLPLTHLSRYIGSRMPKANNHLKPSSRIAIAIMAAGKGTRLKSKHPKVLHEVGGKPLLANVSAAATKVVPASDLFAIIGYQADNVRTAVASTGIN